MVALSNWIFATIELIRKVPPNGIINIRVPTSPDLGFPWVYILHHVLRSYYAAYIYLSSRVFPNWISNGIPGDDTTHHVRGRARGGGEWGQVTYYYECFTAEEQGRQENISPSHKEWVTGWWGTNKEMKKNKERFLVETWELIKKLVWKLR